MSVVDSSNWMSFVRKAHSFEEQNLVITQENNALYFTTTTNILPKTELKVSKHIPNQTESRILSSYWIFWVDYLEYISICPNISIIVYNHFWDSKSEDFNVLNSFCTTIPPFCKALHKVFLSARHLTSPKYHQNLLAYNVFTMSNCQYFKNDKFLE